MKTEFSAYSFKHVLIRKIFNRLVSGSTYFKPGFSSPTQTPCDMFISRPNLWFVPYCNNTSESACQTVKGKFRYASAFMGLSAC